MRRRDRDRFELAKKRAQRSGRFEIVVTDRFLAPLYGGGWAVHVPRLGRTFIVVRDKGLERRVIGQHLEHDPVTGEDVYREVFRLERRLVVAPARRGRRPRPVRRILWP